MKNQYSRLKKKSRNYFSELPADDDIDIDEVNIVLGPAWLERSHAEQADFFENRLSIKIEMKDHEYS